MALQFLSINVNGLRDVSKRDGFLQWLRSLPVLPDIVSIQEAHCVSVDECRSWFSSSGFSFVLSPGSNRSCGSVVLFCSSLSLCKSWCDDAGRYVQCEFSFGGKIFRVVCLYAPNYKLERDQFFDNISLKIDSSIATLLMGDFNAVFDRSVDRLGTALDGTSCESSVALARLFDDCCCVDVWRYLHPSLSSFTWTRWNGTVASRIDLVGCPYVWLSSVLSSEFCPCPFSDHCAVLFAVTVPDAVPPGPGIWKLSTAILSEINYISMITSFWNEWSDSKVLFSNIRDWWEAGKSKIKGLTISYCSRRSQESNQVRAMLVRLADHLKLRVDQGHVSSIGPYHSVLEQLSRFDLEKAKGAQIRARIRWVEEGESSSAYFFRLEKKRSSDRWISALRNDDGTIVSEPSDLCESFVSFYSDLFSCEPTDISAREALLDCVSDKLQLDQAKLCEGLLTADECLSALLGMAKRKAPGSNGLPMEFYVKFWSVLGSDLVDVLNFCYDSGSLSSSQHRGLISLIFKKSDRLDPRNWRPISLLNVDYKLDSRVLAGRLLKVIHLVVNKDQTCGVPGRYIGENVAFLRDVVDFATLSNVPVAVLSLDQEKAFDRVDWLFMLSTLERMGFGHSFINWVRLFYTEVQSAVIVNGYVSSFFLLSRGVRQGCPLSPLLYVLVSEVLAVNIRANPRVVGVSLPGSSSPLSPVSQYADDTSLIASSDDAILACFETYSLFERGSGAKLNQSKSKGLWLGSWSDRSDPPINLEWSSVKIKVLGVFLGPGNLEEDNWLPRLVAVENVLSSWRQRVLSFKGRALVINALALSRIWYVSSLIHMPAWVLSKLCSLVFTFFWSGKRDRVSRSVVVQPTFLGGFAVVDIKLKVMSLLVQWVRRLVSSSSSWLCFLDYWFRHHFNSSIAHVFSHPYSFDPKVSPPFYRTLMYAWRAMDGSGSSTLSSLLVASSDPFQSSSVTAASAKSCYMYLLSEASCDPHCAVKFLSTFGALYWSTTWRELFFFDLDKQVIDLSWKVAHGVLFTVDRLLRFGYSLDPFCFCGPVLETPSHLFFECSLAQSVLSWFQSLLFSFSPQCPSIVCRHVLFGFNSDELRRVPRVFVYILNVCKFFIWHARNDYRFRDIRPGALVVIEKVKARVKFHLPLFFRRFKSERRRRYFHRQWGANGVVGSVVDGIFSFAL